MFWVGGDANQPQFGRHILVVLLGHVESHLWTGGAEDHKMITLPRWDCDMHVVHLPSASLCLHQLEDAEYATSLLCEILVDRGYSQYNIAHLECRLTATDHG